MKSSSPSTRTGLTLRSVVALTSRSLGGESNHEASRTIFACTAVLALSATAASAAVVCNDEGDCWRVKERRDYGPDLKLPIYETIGSGTRSRSIVGGSLELDRILPGRCLDRHPLLVAALLIVRSAASTLSPPGQRARAARHTRRPPASRSDRMGFCSLYGRSVVLAERCHRLQPGWRPPRDSSRFAPQRCPALNIQFGRTKPTSKLRK